MIRLITQKSKRTIELLHSCALVLFNPFNKKHSTGYSMLELLLSSAVGSIVILGSYSSYVIIAKQYSRVSAFAEVQAGGIPTLRLIERDLRMAGHVAVDANIDPVFGAISTPITITDSGNSCCDSIQIIYDKDVTERRRVTYSTAGRTNPVRTALYLDVDLWNGTAWVNSIADSLVTDYVEDLQFTGSDNNASGNPRIVDMSMVIRSKSGFGSDKTYTPPAQIIGNYNYTFTDTFHRDEFTSTVNIKNLRF